ncbi:MAG: T9SS type A sorting domain-containing protein [Ignavibacteriae bacterium]|nr:T9SS type A sorting domain-containing protein [Ignavibacteriota bacterium]
MKKLLLLLLLLSNVGWAQLYQGPASGSVTNGVIVSTGSYLNNLSGDPINPYVRKKLRNKINFKPYSDELNTVAPKAPAGSNYMNDPLAGLQTDAPDPTVFKSFQGFSDPGSYIPPDLYLAVGPTHVIGVDNGRFRIWDKEGRLIKTISADAWFGTTVSGVGAFDPKVIYDHYAKRWVMVWLDQNDAALRGNYLVSVSTDSIPLGTWYNYALPSTLNGTTNSNSWGDYQGVGFDNQAVYLTSNQFAFGGNFQGSKIRIINKTDLYANNAGPVNWKDLWDIREPSSSQRTFGARPSISYTSGSEYYLLVPSPFSTGTFVTLYKITNPLTSPVMTAVNVPVTQYVGPPSANQLGGSTMLIEAGGVGFKFEPIYKNGFIWAVHSVQNSSFTSYSSVRYMKINTTTNASVEDVAMGANGYWHFYPALAVDKDNNVAITYSRSGTTEYIGGFYTSRLSTDPAGLSGSKLVQAGKANYVKDFGGGRNRWGDYSGIWLDPSDQNNFWMLTEYAESPVNTWGAWVTGVRLVPFTGAKLFPDKDSLDFGVRELTYPSDTLMLTITSQGSDTLQISSIQIPNAQYQLLTAVSYPIKLGYNQTKDLKFRFIPTVASANRDSITISSNDSQKPQRRILVKSKGFFINPSLAGTIYGITGSQSNGAFISVNKTTGSGSLIGLSGYTDITGISIRPSDNIMFGVTAGGTSSRLVRVNSTQGDAYSYKDIPIGGIRTIAFDVNNDLYCATQAGLLYKYNIQTNDTHYVGNTAITSLYSIAINPINGQLWGVAVNNKIFKINKTTAASNQVGVPGFSITPSITFNHLGKLYGTSGLGVQVAALISYDTATGVATQIGTTGFPALNAIVISQQTVGIENISSEIPAAYNLMQNYPNPFNPVTNIKFDVPKSDVVYLSVFDALGREVAVLVNERLNAGVYSYKFNSAGIPSGVYYYRLKTSDYSSVKRMVVLK